MGAAVASEIEWNESFFCDCFDNVVKIVNWISRKQNPFTRFQFIVKQLIADKKISCDSVILKSVETTDFTRFTRETRDSLIFF